MSEIIQGEKAKGVRLATINALLKRIGLMLMVEIEHGKGYTPPHKIRFWIGRARQHSIPSTALVVED